MNQKKYNTVGNRNDRICRELLAKELLNEKITHVIDVAEDSYFWKEDIDLICVNDNAKNRFVTIEVKVDGYKPVNGRKYIFCETISNSNKYLISSGREGLGNLFVSKSDYMLYYFIYSDSYLIVDTKELQEFVKANMEKYNVKAANTLGYNGHTLYSSYGLLVPVEDVLKKLNAKIIHSRYRFQDFVNKETKIENATDA